MTLDIYREDNIVYSVEVNNQIEINIINSIDKVVVDFYINNPIPLAVNDYILLNGVRYYIYTTPDYKLVDGVYHYIFDLYHRNFVLNNKLFQNKNQDTSFTLTGNLQTFTELILWNINQTQDNPNGIDQGWTIGNLIDTPYREIIFTNNTCLEVIKVLHETFRCEVDLTIDKTINFYEQLQVDNIVNVHDFQEDVDFEVIHTQNSDNFYTRAYIRGGYKNVPEHLQDEDGYMVSPQVNFLQNTAYYNNIKETKKIFKDEYPYYILPIRAKINYDPQLFNIAVEPNFKDKVTSSTRIKFLSGYYTNIEFEFSYELYTGLIRIHADNLSRVEPGDLITFTNYTIPESEVKKSTDRLNEIGEKWFSEHSYPLVRFTVHFNSRLYQELSSFPIGSRTIFIYQGQEYINLRVLKIVKDTLTNEVILTITNYKDDNLYLHEYEFELIEESPIPDDLINRLEDIEAGLITLNNKIDTEVTRLDDEVTRLDDKIDNLEPGGGGSGHTHPNKPVLDQLTQPNINLLQKFVLDENGRIRALTDLYSDKEISAYGFGGSGGGGGAGALYDLSDTDVANRQTGDVLIYNGTHWVARPQSDIIPDLDGYATKQYVDDAIEAIDVSDGDKHYEHYFAMPSNTWVVEHNLQKYPAITVVDEHGVEVVGEIIHNSTMVATINFTVSFSGRVICN